MQDEFPNLPFYKLEVNVFNPTTNHALRQMETIELSTGAYTYLRLWRVPNNQISNVLTMPGVRLKLEYDQLCINRICFYPQLGEPPIPHNLRQTSLEEQRLWLLLLNNPYQIHRLFDLLEGKKIPIVNVAAGQYGSLIWATGNQIIELEAVVSPNGLLDWIGVYHPYYKMTEEVRDFLISKTTKPSDEIEIEVSLVHHSEVKNSLAELQKLGVNKNSLVEIIEFLNHLEADKLKNQGVSELSIYGVNETHFQRTGHYITLSVSAQNLIKVAYLPDVMRIYVKTYDTFDVM